MSFKFHIKILFFIAFISCIPSKGSSQNVNLIDSLESALNTAKGEDKIQILLELANQHNDLFVHKSIQYGSQALLLAENTEHPSYKAESNYSLGRSYKILGTYDKAQEHFFEALTISEKNNFQVIQAKSLLEIAVIFSDFDHLDKALKYLEEGYDISEKLNSPKLIEQMYINLGLVYSKKSDHQKALEFYFLGLDNNEGKGNKRNYAALLNNIGIVYNETRNYPKAKEYFDQAFGQYSELNIPWGLSEVQNNLGELNINLGNFTIAKDYLEEANQIARGINADILLQDNYKLLSKLYELTADHEKSLHYHKLAQVKNEILMSNELQSNIAKVGTDYEVKKRENKIRVLEKEKKESRTKIIGIIIIFSLIIIIGIILYLKQKNNTIDAKQKQVNQEQLLIAKIGNIELEKKNIEDELKYKNNELTNFALHIVQKNDILQDINLALKKIRTSLNGRGSESIKKLELKIDHSLQNKEEIEKFHTNVEHVNHDFLFKLQSEFPQLTEGEAKLAALLRLNLSSKEIASIYKTSTRAIEMRRFRMRKKLNIDSNDMLSKFFKEL